MSVVNNSARLFVNTIVSEYDTLCHRETAKIPDVFNPHLETGLKESSLQLFSEKLSTAGTGFDQAKFNEEVVSAYKQSSPTLSHLFAITGILDTVPQASGKQNTKDGELQKVKNRVIEAVVQDHLRSKQDQYTLDPWATLMLSMSSEPLPQFDNGKSHFYSQIFLEVYSRSDVLTKRKIVDLLNGFQPQLETRLFKFQRVAFKIEGVFNSLITSRNVKFGLYLALSIGSLFFALDNVVKLKVIAFAGGFFNSAAFAAMSSGVVRYMPVVVVQISNGAYTRIIGVVAYVVSTRLYQLEIGSFQIAPIILPFIICKIVPTLNWVFNPVTTFANTYYQWSLVVGLLQPPSLAY